MRYNKSEESTRETEESVFGFVFWLYYNEVYKLRTTLRGAKRMQV